MANTNTVKLELSLREARVLARAVAASGHLLYNVRAPFERQSEVYRVLSRIESRLGSSMGDLSEKLFGNYGSGSMLRYRWSDEPLSAPFSRAVDRREVA